MARKTLLTEGEIRQFMKLARLAPIGSTKLQEMGHEMAGARDEDYMDDELGATEDELGAEDEFADDEAGELDVDDAEMADDDMDMSGMPDDEREDMMADVIAAVAKALGIEDQVSIVAGTEGGDLDEPAVDDMMGPDEMDVDVEPAGLEPEMGGEEEVAFGDEEEEEPEEPVMERAKKKECGCGAKACTCGAGTSEDDIVAEVAKRVAARLKEGNSREVMVDRLANRIMKRLTK